MEITVLKSKSAKTKEAPLNELAPAWTNRTFRMIVVGEPGQGKSMMIANLVRHYLTWQTLTVIAQHLGGELYENLKEWVEKKEEKEGRPVSVWGETLEELPPLSCYTVQNRNLVWIDDFMNASPKEQKPIVELFSSGRHNGIAIIYTAQSYISVPPNIRRCASCICVFKGYNSDDADKLWSKHGGLMTKKEFHEFLAFATHDDYSFAVIDEQPRHPALRYRVKWDTLYFPK